MPHRIAPLTLLLLTGCTPFRAPSTAFREVVNAKTAAANAPTDATPAVASPAAPGRETVGPYAQPSEQEAMSQIAPQLGQIAAADPELHTKVLEQLAGTKPSLWSLTVQQAQQTLAYRKQLEGADAPATASQPTQVAKAPTAPEPTQVKLDQPPTAPPVAEHRQMIQQVSATEPVSLPKPAPPATTMEVRQTSATGDPTPSVIQNSHYSTDATPGATAVALTPRNQPSAPIHANPTMSAPADWRSHLDSAITQLSSDSGAPPRSSEEARERVRLQLLKLAAGQTDGASSALPGLSSAEQGYWSNQLFALSTMLKDQQSADRRALVDAAARHQAEASAKLRSMGSLQLRNFVTCREVYGYGAYDPLPDPQYTPGDQIILYAEIDNYRSDATSEGYRTTLASSYRLVDEQGKEVAAGDFPEVDDLCLTLRRDFHIQYGVTLPTLLQPGEYRLELTVNDRLGDKLGHDELALTVAGP